MDKTEPFPNTMGAYATIADKCNQLQKQNEELMKAHSDFIKQIRELNEQARGYRAKITRLEAMRAVLPWGQ